MDTIETIIDSRAVSIQILRASRPNALAYAWIDGHNRYTISLRKAYNPQGSFGGGFAGWKATIEIAGRTLQVLEDTQKQAVKTLCRDIINSNNAYA
jgi:hypothetical protein